jgi:hypothetical protein
MKRMIQTIVTVSRLLLGKKKKDLPSRSRPRAGKS